MKKFKLVYLIDNDSVTNFLNERVLDHFGLAEKVQAYENGWECLETLRELGAVSNENMPELIFLDVRMPGMSAWDFLDEFAKHFPENPARPDIVLLSTIETDDDIALARKYDRVKAFMTKPLTIEGVDKLVDTHYAAPA